MRPPLPNLDSVSSTTLWEPCRIGVCLPCAGRCTDWLQRVALPLCGGPGPLCLLPACPIVLGAHFRDPLLQGDSALCPGRTHSAHLPPTLLPAGSPAAGHPPLLVSKLSWDEQELWIYLTRLIQKGLWWQGLEGQLCSLLRRLCQEVLV